MSYKKSEKIICFNPDAPTSHYRDEKTREIVHEYKKSITVEDIDKFIEAMLTIAA